MRNVEEANLPVSYEANDLGELSVMAHNHGHEGNGHHGHAHGPANYGRAFAIGITLNLGFVVAEVVYGILAHSVALLADAGHN